MFHTHLKLKKIVNLALFAICFFINSFVYVAPVIAKQSVKKTLVLSPEIVLQEVLTSSPYIEKIKLSAQKNQAQILQAQYVFSDWGLLSNYNQTERKNPLVDKFLPNQSDVNSWLLSLEKKIPYGFSLSSGYSSTNEKSLNSSLLKQFRPNNLYRKKLNIELKSNLTSALSQFYLFKGFKQAFSVTELVYFEQAEQLAIKALTQYWKSYIAWVGLKQAQEGIKTYKKLVKQINNKKKYNFLQPGERPQVLANYQNLQKTLDKAKHDYEKEKNTLLIYLKKSNPNQELLFKHKTSLIRPFFKKIQPELTRVISIQKKRIENQKLQLLAEKALLYPRVELIAKQGWTPSGETSDLRFSSKEAFYEVGVNLKWILFSKSFYQSVNQKKYELEENKIDFKILKQELINNMALLEKQIDVAYENIERTKKANRYQKKAFTELQRSFNQGRVDIFQLIQTEKQVRESEVQKTIAYSEYSIYLASYLALRDELLPRHLKP